MCFSVFNDNVICVTIVSFNIFMYHNNISTGKYLKYFRKVFALPCKYFLKYLTQCLVHDLLNNIYVLYVYVDIYY